MTILTNLTVLSIILSQIDDKPESMKSENDAINPWIPSTMGDLLKRINALLTKSEVRQPISLLFTWICIVKSDRTSFRWKIYKTDIL